jgi:hypothetical protein
VPVRCRSYTQESKFEAGARSDESAVHLNRRALIAQDAVVHNEGLPAICGKYDLSFVGSEPEAYPLELPSAEVHVRDAGHFAFDTAADQIAALVRGFVGTSP